MMLEGPARERANGELEDAFEPSSSIGLGKGEASGKFEVTPHYLVEIVKGFIFLEKDNDKRLKSACLSFSKVVQDFSLSFFSSKTLFLSQFLTQVSEPTGIP